MIPDLGSILFYSIIMLIVLSSYWVVMSPNLVHSAVALLFTLFGVAGLYVYLYADFIAATQVIIYVGGILVLIIFGVMLTNKIDDPKLVTSILASIPILTGLETFIDNSEIEILIIHRVIVVLVPRS